MSKKVENKKKDNYFKFSFLFPVVFSSATAMLLMLALTAASMGENVGNSETVRTIMQLTAYSITFSPSALMICAFISMRHSKKNPEGSRLYRQMPMTLSVIVLGLEVLYLASLAF